MTTLDLGYDVVHGHRYDEDAVAAAVAAHFSGRGYVAVREVPAPPAASGGRMIARRIDLLLVRIDEPADADDTRPPMWAVEVKVTRQDFLAELRNPDKQAPWLGATGGGHFYAAPANLLRPTEVPSPSGLIEIDRKVHPIHGDEYDVARVAKWPNLWGPAVIPEALVRHAFERAAVAEARLAGVHADTTPHEALHAENTLLKRALDRARSQTARAEERAGAWRTLAAAQGHKVPCSACGAPVKPTRVSAGALAGWRHAQPHLTVDCPGNTQGVHPAEETEAP